MKSLSKKNVKKNTKKRLGKSKKHNKSKKTHKKSRKQQKGGFVINEYEGIQNIPATATKDIQNARAAHSGDWTPRVIAMLCIIFFGGYIFTITFMPHEDNSEAIINLVLGYLGGVVSAIVSYYFGASQSKDG